MKQGDISFWSLDIVHMSQENLNPDSMRPILIFEVEKYTYGLNETYSVPTVVNGCLTKLEFFSLTILSLIARSLRVIWRKFKSCI